MNFEQLMEKLLRIYQNSQALKKVQYKHKKICFTQGDSRFCLGGAWSLFYFI